MKNLIIIGARGWGREVYHYFHNEPSDNNLVIKGFLDSDKDALKDAVGDFPPILSSVEDYIIQPEDVFFCAMGESRWRRHYVDIIESKGGKFVSYISPKADVFPTAVIGEGSFITGHSLISDNVSIGKHVLIHSLCTLGHDVIIGDFVTIEAYSFFGGYSEVGDNTTIHVRSTIIRHKKVGSNVSVGAGSVVMRNVKDGVSVFGNPATLLK
jgi:sugar O-acyltransferase (sialic acid O-acetyltransferase NeuD family)